MTELVENLEIKSQSEEELFRNLIENRSWDEREIALVSSAYELARNLHQNDTHKGMPYIYHLLRVANRIVGYLHINDAEVVAAALLHDSVEDHAAEICPDSAEQNRFIEQKNALDIISQQFSPRVAMDVAAVTNEPKDSKITYDNKLIKYLAKVQQATSTVDGWLIKFSDWCDNAVGIVHNGKEELSPDKIKHFQRKYGEVIDIFEKRFHDSDIQEVLDYQAKAYVEHQLNLGRSRLLGKSNDPEATDILGF